MQSSLYNGQLKDLMHWKSSSIETKIRRRYIRCIYFHRNVTTVLFSGYIIQVKLKPNQSESGLNEIANYLTHRWPTCRLESGHNNLFTFRLATNEVKLSALFGDIERVKGSLPVEDYSICQTSLERIFLSFARKQRQTA